MAVVTARKKPKDRILSLFPLPLYTHTGICYEEDLEDLGLEKVLDRFPRKTADRILEQTRRLASIQPELALHFLLDIERLRDVIGLKEMGKWVSLVLDIYDSKGLNPAREFMLELDRHPDFDRHWGGGLPFGRVYGVLLNYLRGLGKRGAVIEEAAAHYTDVVTVYLPKRISLFEEDGLNFLLYKAMVTHKFAQIHLGTFRFRPGRAEGLSEALRRRYGRLPPEGLRSELSRFFHLFPEPLLARDLFLLSDTVRIEGWMAETLPGLHRELGPLKKRLAERRPAADTPSPRTLVVDCLVRAWLSGKEPAHRGSPWEQAAHALWKRLKEGIEPGMTVEALARFTAEAYRTGENFQGPYQETDPIPYAGELRPEEAEVGRRRRRKSVRVEFRKELAKLLKDLPDYREVTIEIPGMEKGSVKEGAPGRQEVPKEFVVNGNPIPVPEAMQKTIEEILEDLGSLPASYVASSRDMSGHFHRPLYQMPEGTGGNVLSPEGEGVHVMDEWDFRRQGYRKGWALLRESDAPEGDPSFARETLHRHRGMVRQIKNRFERIRMEETLLRRRKEGDGIDLDAAIEAFSDRRAGLSPSESLFVRRQRNRRDIASAFLIDLSGSTSGWINEMERAALLILGEAMQVLQDRFAVYGFSGRTRKRCEFFRIKGFDEPYGETVKGRIANLTPREYTRLGPPIRRLNEILSRVEARTRLLITLSDGKPDDWDGYGGDYGIEDTRQALMESKRKGIHPFCITIDKAEHSYLEHMFGRAHYIFIDDLSKLPLKMPDIYRKLTT